MGSDLVWQGAEILEAKQQLFFSPSSLRSNALKQLSLFSVGCSYLYEVENEVHSNSSVEIYYQVRIM